MRGAAPRPDRADQLARRLVRPAAHAQPTARARRRSRPTARRMRGCARGRGHPGQRRDAGLRRIADVPRDARAEAVLSGPAERAARAIVRGLEENRPRISFPVSAQPRHLVSRGAAPGDFRAAACLAELSCLKHSGPRSRRARRSRSSPSACCGRRRPPPRGRPRRSPSTWACGCWPTACCWRSCSDPGSPRFSRSPRCCWWSPSATPRAARCASPSCSRISTTSPMRSGIRGSICRSSASRARCSRSRPSRCCSGAGWRWRPACAPPPGARRSGAAARCSHWPAARCSAPARASGCRCRSIPSRT